MLSSWETLRFAVSTGSAKEHPLEDSALKLRHKDAVKGSSALVCAVPDKAHNRDRSDR